MSDIKVVAFESDMKELENLIKSRTGSTEDLSFPDGFVAEIPKMRDYLEDYLNGTLTEYTDYSEVIPSRLLYYYKDIQSLHFPNALEIGDEAMYQCENLTNIDCENVEKIGYSAFAYNNVSSIDLPKLKFAEYGLFSNCKSLENVSCKSIDAIPSGMFSDCTLLKNVYLPKATIAGGSSFRGCTSLSTISLPNVVESGGMDFYGCSSLTTVDCPALEYLRSQTFYKCTALTKVVLPSATIIEGATFSGCTELNTLVITQLNTVCSLTHTNALASTKIADGTGFIFVPDSLVEQYKIATNWSTYADQIKPLSEYIEE